RRPVKIDFCEADVLDVFDEWRRAIGVPSPQSPVPGPQPPRNSLPAHLERVLLRLSSARASGALGDAFDALIDRVSSELDAARGKAGGLRATARQALIDRLAAVDAELLQIARASLAPDAVAALAREADDELARFRTTMPAATYARVRDAAIDRLVRDHFGLPTVSV